MIINFGKKMFAISRVKSDKKVPNALANTRHYQGEYKEDTSNPVESEITIPSALRGEFGYLKIRLE